MASNRKGTEVTNQAGGKSGAKVPIKRGPVGKQSGNPTKSGGIFRPTKGKS